MTRWLLFAFACGLASLQPCTCSEACKTNHFGECDIVCDITENCSNHGRCDEDGTCACQLGWGGDACSESDSNPAPCTINRFGECEVVCDITVNCSNHGRCDDDGTCACQLGWGGDTCSTAVTPCMTNRFGECEVVCDITANCSDHGRCDDDGTCACQLGWSGDTCSAAESTSAPPAGTLPSTTTPAPAPPTTAPTSAPPAGTLPSTTTPAPAPPTTAPAAPAGPLPSEPTYVIPLLGLLDPSFRALSGRLRFTVRGNKFNKDALFSRPCSLSF
jgi:hypothetical protein